MKRLLFVALLLASIPRLCFAETIADTTAVSTRINLKQSLAGAGVSLVVNASVTELLKHTIKERRPDGSDNGSFPSRHSSYAFTLASIASHELSRFSPFWTIAAQTAANAVSMQRVYASRHYPSDVLAGAAIGIASTELGYEIARWIYPDRGPRPVLSPLDNMPGLSASTSALLSFTSRGEGLSTGCGIESALHINLPVSDYFGLGASFRMRSQTIYYYGEYRGALNGASLTLDGYAFRGFGVWGAEGAVSVGLLRNFDRPMRVASSWSGLLDISAGIHRRIARALSVGGRIGCDITERPGSWCAMSVSLVTKAEF
ncbi:MAG: phosphatase PAP2 family protein [Muribaculaceae bacterium]|nr:phosphatase PAP2 family protein [Muribaculaceae bacterium]